MRALGEVGPPRGSDISARAFNICSGREGVPALPPPSCQPGMPATSPGTEPLFTAGSRVQLRCLALGLCKIHSHKSSSASYICIGLKSSAHKESTAERAVFSSTCTVRNDEGDIYYQMR